MKAGNFYAEIEWRNDSCKFLLPTVGKKLLHEFRRNKYKSGANPSSGVLLLWYCIAQAKTYCTLHRN